MKATIFSYFILLSLGAFAQQDTLVPARLTYEFFSNKTIDVVKQENAIYPELKDGNMVVFQYSKQHAQNPAVSDDEIYESVQFEVNATWNSFIFKRKLKMSKAIYNLGCFCIGRGYQEPFSGYIKGKKLPDGTYAIDADLTIKYETGVTKQIKFSGIFKPAHAG
jgi:hypothetical protein